MNETAHFLRNKARIVVILKSTGASISVAKLTKAPAFITLIYNSPYPPPIISVPAGAPDGAFLRLNSEASNLPKR